MFNLFVTHDRIMGDLQKRLSVEGFHFLEALVITGLFFEERDVRPTELANTFLASKSNMSHTLRSLEKKGWIERKTSLEDARAYFFGLTREGKKRAAKLIKIMDATQEHFEKALVSHRINQNLKSFQRVYALLDVK